MTIITAVLGSVTPPGRLSNALHDILGRAAENGHQVQLLDLGTLRLDFADGRPASEHSDDSALAIDAIQNAEAVLLATPVYRGSMTGSLKNFLDLLPIECLQGKPVAIVAMGATQHHFLGVESHLRDVLAWFGALVTPVNVYLAGADFVDGKISDPAAAQIDEVVVSLTGLASATRGQSFGPVPLAARRT